MLQVQTQVCNFHPIIADLLRTWLAMYACGLNNLFNLVYVVRTGRICSIQHQHILELMGRKRNSQTAVSFLSFFFFLNLFHYIYAMRCSSLSYYTKIIIPQFVRLYEEKNPRALASGLFSVQADKTWYNYFEPPSSLQTLLGMKYFVLELAIFVKGFAFQQGHGITIRYTMSLLKRETTFTIEIQSHF